jgi:hypothetical protein
LRFGDFFLADDLLAADFLAPFFFGDRFFEAGLAALRFFAIADGSFNPERPSHFRSSFPRALRCGERHHGYEWRLSDAARCCSLHRTRGHCFKT